MSLKELSNYQINQFENSSPHFGGCYSRDVLPPIRNRFYIINLDSNSGPGTHWVLLYNCDPHTSYYFDSYGMPPPQEIVEAMKHSNKKRVFNDVDLQALGSDACGWWCMYIANALDEGQNFVTTIKNAAKQKPSPDKYLAQVFHS